MNAGFGVYLHWPFCASKCPYCDFNSHVRFSAPNEARYIAAFKRELDYFKSLTGERTLDSIFFGGGTPSLMQPETVHALIDYTTKLWPASKNIEITLEANPTSVEAERFRGYAQAGINRVSMGIQSLNDVDLKFLGRLHTSAEALKAIKIAASTFPRFSFDLIYARPKQSIAGWKEELTRAIGEGTTHLSLYQLTIEEGTAFYQLHKAGKFTMPNEELAREFYDVTQELTAQAGLPAYEISNHAKIGEESRHNLIYWRMGDYVGAGAGAHGRITNAQGRFATNTLKSPEAWLESVEIKGNGLEEQEKLTDNAIIDEFLLMGLRLKEGIDLARFKLLSPKPLNETRLANLFELGLLWQKNGRLGVTAQGFPILNAIIAELAAHD